MKERGKEHHGPSFRAVTQLIMFRSVSNRFNEITLRAVTIQINSGNKVVTYHFRALDKYVNHNTRVSTFLKILKRFPK